MSTNYLSKEINNIKLKLTESSLSSMPKRQKKLKNESTSSSSESKQPQPQRSYSTSKGESSFISELKNTFGLSTALIKKKKSIKAFNNKNHIQPLQQQSLQQQQQYKQLTISDLKKQFLKIFNAKTTHVKKSTYRVKKGKCKQNQPTLSHNSNNNSNSTNVNYNINNHTTLSTDYTLLTLPQVSIDLNCTKDLSANEVRDLTNKLKLLSVNQLKHINYSYIKELKNLHKVIDGKINMDKCFNHQL